MEVQCVSTCCILEDGLVVDKLFVMRFSQSAPWKHPVCLRSLCYIVVGGYVSSFILLLYLYIVIGFRGITQCICFNLLAQMFEALCYKPEYRGFDSRWGHWTFQLTYPSSRTVVLVSTHPLTEMSTRNLPGGKGRPARKADNHTVICEPII
jgi:hypothetical protein